MRRRATPSAGAPSRGANSCRRKAAPNGRAIRWRAPTGSGAPERATAVVREQATAAAREQATAAVPEQATAAAPEQATAAVLEQAIAAAPAGGRTSPAEEAQEAAELVRQEEEVPEGQAIVREERARERVQTAREARVAADRSPVRSKAWAAEAQRAQTAVGAA